jgi:hypothetical protein
MAATSRTDEIITMAITATPATMKEQDKVNSSMDSRQPVNSPADPAAAIIKAATVKMIYEEVTPRGEAEIYKMRKTKVRNKQGLGDPIMMTRKKHSAVK